MIIGRFGKAHPSHIHIIADKTEGKTNSNTINKTTRCTVEEIHSVGTINNIETSYFTQLKNVLLQNETLSLGNIFQLCKVC